MHQNNLSAQTGNKQNTNIYFEHDHDSIVKLERMNLFRLLVLRCQGKMYALLALLLTQKMGGAHKNWVSIGLSVDLLVSHHAHSS